jgi:putative tryptophan/tyrosine transport system substrate-binding protein
MRRREVIGLFGSAAAWTAAARAQTVQKVPRIGILDLAPTNSEPGLRRGLRELGYIEGQNIIIEVRYADGRQERLPELAADLLRLKMDIIASATTQAIQAVRRADPAIPIVMTNISDPIGSGLADTLSHPGGNTTGVTMLSTEVAAKRLALLKEAFPALERVAVLAYGRHPPTALLFRESAEAAKALDLEVQLLEVDLDEIEQAFATILRGNAGAVVVQQATALNPFRQRIAELAIEHRLPTMHEVRPFVEVGGLMAYGANPLERGHRSAAYIDKILKGARPGDLPIEQATRFHLIINLKTAKALSLEIPPTLLARADEVIE